MDTRVVHFVFVLCLGSAVLSIHTSDKLDFGDTPHRSSLISEKKLPVKVTRTIDAITSPSEHISVTCGETGCNTTNNNNSSVETEVVVRVKTNVNLDKKENTKIVEDVSDVPVVVGYRGSAPDETPDEEQFRSFSRDATPDPNDEFSRRDRPPYRPLYTNSPINIGGKQGQFTERSGFIGGEYGRRGLYSDSPYGHRYTNYRSQSDGYSGQSFSTTPISTGYYGPTSTSRTPINYYDPSSPRTVEINGVPPALSVTVPSLNRRNYDFNPLRDNEAEIRIPYFEHTYNKHHFSEEPPPHTSLYSKVNTFNPVEFRNIPRNKWRPFLNGRPNKYAFTNDGNNFINPYTHNNPTYNYPQHHYRGHGEGCSCREHGADDISTPYASASSKHHISVPNKDPGASINDKLAPLN